MSNVDEFSPDPALYESLPEEVVKSVLSQAGFSDDTPSPSTLSPPTTSTPTEEAAGEPEPPRPQAPGGPLFKDDTDTSDDDPNIITLPDGRKYPLALVEEWANASTRPTPTPPSPSPTIPADQPPLPPAAYTPALPVLPQITEDDLELAGPAVRALLMIASAQAQQMQQIQSQISQTREAVDVRTRRDNAEIANSAASSFQTSYNLPDDLMLKIKNTVQVSDIDHYLQTDYDTYKAVEYALTRSYWNLPEARQFEFERQTDNRNAALVRKQKLTGVSGNSGSGPRNTPPPDMDTAEGRHAAAVEMARQAMYGDE